MRLLVLLALTACPAGRRLDPPRPYGVLRAPLTLQLAEGLETTGELTFPAAGRGPHPTVILVGGSGPQDQDATVQTPYGTVAVFAPLADALSERGFAVVRVNKRHVEGPDRFDLPAFVKDASTQVFRDDLEAVLAGVVEHPRVDRGHVFLYGWGEGSVIASAVAAEHPELAGLVLVGPVGVPWRDTFRGWFTDLTVPYLRRFATDGALDGEQLGRALHSAASAPTLLTTSMLVVSWSRNDVVARPTPMIDRDRDGRIDLEAELIPRIDDLVALAFGPLGSLQIYAEGRSLPPVAAQVDGIRVPVVVLQGTEDAQTPPANTDAIEAALLAAAHPDASVYRFPGLGHTLGRARDPVDDLPRPMDPAAVQVLTDWLVAHAR